MKILLIGHYRDGTGYGEACKNYAKAMDSVGLDVVLRPFRLNSHREELDGQLLKLESKSSVGADVCIQHTLPIHMHYNGRFKKNIALFASETFGMQQTSWADHLRNMDELWVINRQMWQEWRHVNKNTKIIPHACDLSKYSKEYSPLNLPLEQFSFYFISELSRRKNLVALLKAFHSEFARNEPVSLIIKTYQHGKSDVDVKNLVVEMCNMVKTNLKLLPNNLYKKEIIITQRLSEEQLMRLHATTNCLVAPSYGEAWGQACIDALGMGNSVICTDIDGQFPFIHDLENGYRVKAHEEPCFGMTDTFPELYTSRETWHSVDIDALMGAMRHAFEMGMDKEVCKESVKQYSYEKVGQQIMEALC